VFAGRALASSSSPLVTRAGLRVLEQAGNAVDAAVAMAGMLALAELVGPSASTQLGGLDAS
jgi:gamma-glutamyltranspeptidase/glutathione hydrolase